MYNGVLNVYKEPGFTSFDVVAKLRGILHQKKIGHTGTLDPEAEGVLVVCLGKATKLCEILTDKDKSYEATLRLGVRTDTEDATGKILSEEPVLVSEEEIRCVISSFLGEQDQIPPMYSAIKVQGKKLYELARQGIEIERQPRRIVIHELEILDISLPYVRFRVSCGKGTYIRSLCRDIGDKLGCGGVMERLVRSGVNSTETGKSFLAEDALTLFQIEQLEQAGELNTKILAIDDMFPRLPKYVVTEEGNKKLLNGNILKVKDFKTENVKGIHGEECLVYDPDGAFTAIYRYEKALDGFKASKMFV